MSEQNVQVTQALEPCPFCGNDGKGSIENALHVTHCELPWRDSYDAYSVQCDKCTATMGYSDTEEEAIAAWNARFEHDTEKRVRESLAERTVPVAWLHTLHMEGGQNYTRLLEDDGRDEDEPERTAFGLPGRDYSEEYTVTSEPLYRAARESLAGEANVERVAQRIERAPVRIYRTPDEARAYMLGRADAVALVRAKLVGDVDDHIAALAAQPPSSEPRS